MIKNNLKQRAARVTDKTKLTRGKRVLFFPDYRDGRRKMVRAVYSYFDAQCVEYRRGFSAPRGTSPDAFDDIAPIEITLNEQPQDAA